MVTVMVVVWALADVIRYAWNMTKTLQLELRPLTWLRCEGGGWGASGTPRPSQAAVGPWAPVELHMSLREPPGLLCRGERGARDTDAGVGKRSPLPRPLPVAHASPDYRHGRSVGRPALTGGIGARGIAGTPPSSCCIPWACWRR